LQQALPSDPRNPNLYYFFWETVPLHLQNMKQTAARTLHCIFRFLMLRDVTMRTAIDKMARLVGYGEKTQEN